MRPLRVQVALAALVASAILSAQDPTPPGRRAASVAGAGAARRLIEAGDSCDVALMSASHRGSVAEGAPPEAARCDARRTALRSGGPGAHPSQRASFMPWGPGA